MNRNQRGALTVAVLLMATIVTAGCQTPGPAVIGSDGTVVDGPRRPVFTAAEKAVLLEEGSGLVKVYVGKKFGTELSAEGELLLGMYRLGVTLFISRMRTLGVDDVADAVSADLARADTGHGLSGVEAASMTLNASSTIDALYNASTIYSDDTGAVATVPAPVLSGLE